MLRNPVLRVRPWSQVDACFFEKLSLVVGPPLGLLTLMKDGLPEAKTRNSHFCPPITQSAEGFSPQGFVRWSGNRGRWAGLMF